MHDFNIKNVYIDKTDKIVKEYNNEHHRRVKMKPIHADTITYINCEVENNIYNWRLCKNIKM